MADIPDKCLRRPKYAVEVRRDGKDDDVVKEVIKQKFNKMVRKGKGKQEIERKLKPYAHAAWRTMDGMNRLFLDDDKPENERLRLDPDHWYENNTTNASLFANLTLDGLPQLVPGRLFTTRMPRNIVKDPKEKQDWIDKCKKNNLKVILVLTEPEEFKKYSGMEDLLGFYKRECGLTVYNRPIPDFQIPTSGDLIDNILDLIYHLSQGQNCLIHCAGGTGRTGMVVAAIFKNLGVFDPIPRIRKVKSTYVETFEQEAFLKKLPSSIDSRIVKTKPLLAKAIAAEHLLQVFLTRGNTQVSADDNLVGQVDSTSQQKLKSAYGEVFDLLDTDKSGSLDKNELMEWFKMVGAELDLTKVTGVLLKEGSLSRKKFSELMSSFTTSNRREYDITGSHH